MKPESYSLRPGRVIAAVSVDQPFATLLTRKERKFLTRAGPLPDWISVGDEVAIQSSTRWTVEQYDLATQHPAIRRGLALCERVPGQNGPVEECLPRGRVLSVCRLVEVVEVEEAVAEAEARPGHDHPDLSEFAIANTAWRLRLLYVYSNAPFLGDTGPQIRRWIVEPDRAK